jgi:hypothetical protein
MVVETTRLPVHSAIFMHYTGELVVKWVTIGESLLLYAFAISFWLLHLLCDRYEDARNLTTNQHAICRDRWVMISVHR